MGHSVRIIPAQFVKPYVKSNKNDIIDAAAIAEAATRPTMRFVGVKQADQVDLQMLHRVRSRLVSARTNLICQMRAYCLEHSIAMRQGAGVFKVDICRVMDDLDNDLTPMARSVLRDLHDDFRRLEARIRQVSDDIEKIADTDERARRLMTIPGIGPLSATAILSAIGDPTRFSKARDIAAWLGLVTRQYSTGGKQNLLGISKRGNNYLRRLIIHGARSCMLHLDRGKDRLGVWIDTLRLRMHVNKVTVALAAKLARIVWVVLTKPGPRTCVRSQLDPIAFLAVEAGQIARFEGDDETVDRHSVNPGRKRASCPKKLFGNRMCGSHQGLAATAVHSREAGYIYANCYRRNLESLQ